MENKLPFGIKNKASVSTSIRGKGTVETFANKSFYGNYFDQLLFETKADHAVNTEVLIKLDPPQGTCYFNSTAGEFQDSSDATATFLDGDKILWVGLDTITTNIDISTVDDLTHIMYQGVTLNIGAYDLSLGENQRGELNVTGTTGKLNILSSSGLKVFSSAIDIANVDGDVNVNGNSGKSVDFDAVGLVVNKVSDTSCIMYAKSISLINESFNKIVLKDVDETYVIGDLMAGHTEQANQALWLWYDHLGNRLLVPDVTGSANGTTAGFLVFTTNTWYTQGVSAGDEVYNETTRQSTTVKTTPTADANPLELNDDIFTSGNLFRIRILSPAGMSSYKAKLGVIINNAIGNFENSGYARPTIQTPTVYNSGNGYNVSGTNWTTQYAAISPIQKLDSSGLPIWEADIYVVGSETLAVSPFTISIDNIDFLSTIQSFTATDGNGEPCMATCLGGNSVTFVHLSTPTGAKIFRGVATFTKKPAFVI